MYSNQKWQSTTKTQNLNMLEQGVKSGMLAKRIFLPVCNISDVNLTYFGNSRSLILLKSLSKYFQKKKVNALKHVYVYVHVCMKHLN